MIILWINYKSIRDGPATIKRADEQCPTSRTLLGCVCEGPINRTSSRYMELASEYRFTSAIARKESVSRCGECPG